MFVKIVVSLAEISTHVFEVLALVCFCRVWFQMRVAFSLPHGSDCLWGFIYRGEGLLLFFWKYPNILYLLEERERQTIFYLHTSICLCKCYRYYSCFLKTDLELILGVNKILFCSVQGFVLPFFEITLMLFVSLKCIAVWSTPQKFYFKWCTMLKGVWSDSQTSMPTLELHSTKQHMILFSTMYVSSFWNDRNQ